MSIERIDVPSGYEFAFKRPADLDYIDMGPTANDAVGTMESEDVEVTSSTGTLLKKFRKNATIDLTLSFYQRFFEKMSAIMGGFTNYTVQAAAPIAVTDEDYLTTEWALNTFIPFKNQNGAGTVPASISVLNDGLLTLNTDYIVLQVGQQWGIIVLDTVNTDIAETLEINYTYTPNAKEVMSVGSSAITLTPFAIRLRKPLDGGKYETAYIYSVTNENGLNLSMARHDADDVDITEVTLRGRIDTTRSSGDQLFRLEREV
jgi:hypothetical protein